MLQKKNPTVLIINKEESSLYILFFNSMILIQEVFFVYSRNGITRDNLGKTKTIANTQITNTIYFSRHYDFYLRKDYAIIGAEKICSTCKGRILLVSRPKKQGLIFSKKVSIRQKYRDLPSVKKLIYLLSL